MNAEALVELQGVDARDEDRDEVVLRGVDWGIVRGEFWAVGGPPAAGKSALLTTAAGLNPPAAGTVRLFGQELATATEEQQVAWRRRTGFVFAHGGRLFRQLTVYDNIALPLLYHETMPENEVAARVEWALARAELKAHAHTMPSRLSPRLQPRVALLRALIVPTELLFLDDPLGGLPRSEAAWWTQFLAEQHRAGLTIVLTCGDFTPWRAVANRFALIREKQFLAIEPAAVPEWV